MAEYESLAHLPRWRRAIIWLCEDRAGYTILSAALGTIAFIPAYWLGGWWFAIIIVAGLSFALGWNAARRRWLRDGFIDRI